MVDVMAVLMCACVHVKHCVVLCPMQYVDVGEGPGSEETPSKGAEWERRCLTSILTFF